MALEDVVQAIQLEGGDEIVTTLNRIAEVGEDTFNRITEALSTTGGSFTAFTEGVVGLGSALAIATAATVAFVESQDKAITSLVALASTFGTTTEEIQGIKESFAQVGISGTVLDRSLSILQRNIGQQWASIAQEVRTSATSQARDQLQIQSATLGTQKAVESLAEAEEHAANLAANQANQRVSAANAVTAAEQKQRDLLAPGSVSTAEKDLLKQSEAQASLAEARQRQNELAQRQLDEQIKAENSVRDAVLAVQKAKLSEAEASEKSHELDLRDLPKIAAQLNDIAAGYGSITSGINLTEVSTSNLERAVILAAGGLDAMRRPEGIEVFTKLSEVFKGLGDSADAMGVKMELVQRLLSAGFRGGGASAAEMVIAIQKGQGAVDELTESIKRSSYALGDENKKAAADSQAAWASLEGEFSRVAEKLAALASPVVTEWLIGIKASLEESGGALHVFISGIEAISAVVGEAIGLFQNLMSWIDRAFNAEPGTALRIVIIGIGIAVAALLPLWIAIPAVIGLVIYAAGQLKEKWDDIVGSVRGVAQAVSDFEVRVESGFAAMIAKVEQPFKDMWEGFVAKIQAAIDKAKEFFGLKATPGAVPGGEPSAVAPIPGGPGGQWRGGPAGAFAEGGLVSQLAASIRRFANGGGNVQGPGTGTSDSILARLSNGEFVMRAAAVRAYGSDIMHAINNMEFPGFAMGGPVAIPVRSGAGDGAAHAGSVLNLTIDGEHFNGLRAPQDVAAKLTHFAISRQTSTTGRQPSWVK